LNKIDEDFYNLAIVQIKELKNAKPELNETLEFYESTLNAQRHINLSFQPDVSVFKADTCRDRNSKGLPLLKPEDIEIDPLLLNKLLEDLCQIVRDRKKEAIPATFKITSLSEQHKQLVKGLIEDASIIDKLAAQAMIDPEVLYFLADQAVSPFVSCYAEKLQEFVDSNSWLRGYCPICSREPLISQLKEESGKRWLFARFAIPSGYLKDWFVLSARTKIRIYCVIFL